MSKLIIVKGVKFPVQYHEHSHKESRQSERPKRMIRKGRIPIGKFKIPNRGYSSHCNYDCVKVMSRV